VLETPQQLSPKAAIIFPAAKGMLEYDTGEPTPQSAAARAIFESRMSAVTSIATDHPLPLLQIILLQDLISPNPDQSQTMQAM
jgi:hypothetical protein